MRYYCYVDNLDAWIRHGQPSDLQFTATPSEWNLWPIPVIRFSHCFAAKCCSLSFVDIGKELTEICGTLDMISLVVSMSMKSFGGNTLDGPRSTGSLVDLRVLILSHNNFTGQVPDLSSLTVNDVNEVKVKSQNPISFCKNQALAVGVIPRPHMSAKKSNVGLIFGIIGAVLGGIVLVGVAFFVFKHVYGKKMVKKPPPRVIAENGTGSYISKLLSNAKELEEAANGFDTSTLMVEGSHGQYWNDHFFCCRWFVVNCNDRFPEEFLCWVGISRNYLLNKDTYPLFEYENGDEMDLNAFICTADPRKVRINERPIVTVAKHRTVTLLPTSVSRPSGELSESIEREFGEDGSGGGGQEDASVAGHGNVRPVVPITDDIVAEADVSRPKRSKKKRVIRGSEGTPAASHPPKRLRADYGRIGGSTAGGKSPGVLNKLLQDSRLSVEQGVTALPTLPFITSSVTASPLEEGGDHTDSVTGPSLRSVAASARFVVLSDSSHHSATNSAGPEGDSFVRSVVPVMTEATTVTTIATTVAIPADVGKDKSVPHPSVFGSSSSSEKTDRTLSLFTGRSGSGFAAGSIRAEEVTDAGLEEIYVPEWTVTKGFELNDGRSCANMIDHFTPPAFFKTVRGMEHEQLFAEFNVSAARNLSLSSEVRMRAEYNILEKRKWRSLAEEKDSLLGAKDKEIEELRSQLLKAKEESVVNQGLVSQVRELETSSARLREQLDLYEENMKRCLYALPRGFHSATHLTSLQDRSTINKKDASTWEVEKIERNLVERLPFLKDVFVSLDHPLSAEALIEPPVVVPATNALPAVVIVPHSGPSVSVEDYENPDLVDVVPKNVTLRPEGEENIDALTGGDLAFSKLDDEARDVVL
ncbi:putative gypsy type transposase [Tanacetum coccineum]